jgi:mono/diheme cytochrome c family protein
MAMSGWQTIVRFVRSAVAVATAAFVILLFTNEPQRPAAVPATGTADTGHAIFATRCASCHGDDAGGGFGPALAGVVVHDFPDPRDQQSVVANGRGAMPSFRETLSAAQIAAVVDYTRSLP